MEEVIYLTLNDWIPPKEHERFLEDLEYLDRAEEIEKEVCIAVEPFDYSFNYYISCTKSWLEREYPELLETDEYFKGRRPFHLDYKPENYGLRYYSTEDIDRIISGVAGK